MVTKGQNLKRKSVAVAVASGVAKGAKAEEPKAPPTLREDIVSRVLVVCEIAGKLATADRQHTQTVSEGRGDLWNGFMTLAHELGAQAFSDYWEGVKPTLKLPENAEKYGAEPDQKSPGKYNISHYLTETVSRIRSAQRHRIILKTKTGFVPRSKLEKKIAEANEIERNEKRAEHDPHYKVRVEIAAEIVKFGGLVRKGSHSLQTLETLRAMLVKANEILSHDKGEVKKAVATALNPQTRTENRQAA